MNNDIIKSYLVSLGFKIDHPQLDQFNNALKQAGYEVTKLTSGMAKEFVVAGSVVAGALASVAAGTVALMDHTAQADLGYQLFARRMFMSTDAAKQLKIATDALGYSLEDIVWGPRELQERFHQLLSDQKELAKGLGGADFEKQMRQVRDIRFEFTRLGVEGQYFVMSLTKSLSKAMFGDENGLLKRLQEFNTWFIRNIPHIADQVTHHLVPALRDIYAIGADIGHVFRDIASSFIKFTGFVAGIDKLKGGEVSIENIATAFERWVKAIRNIADTIKEIWDSPAGRAIFGAAAGGIVGGLPGAVIGGVTGGASAMGQTQNEYPNENPSDQKRYLQNLAREAARKYGVDPSVFMGLIDRESGWNPTATNRESGAYGLTQIMPRNFHMYGEDATSTKENLDIGAHLLSDLLKKHRGDIRGALKDYGGFVTKDPTEYQDYVLKHAEKYRGSLQPTAYREGGGQVTYGDINVHVSHPNATAEEIAQAVRQEISKKENKDRQRNLTQLSGTYA